MNIKKWKKIVNSGFANASAAYSSGANWWPGQAPGTTLSWAIAMQWAFRSSTPYLRTQQHVWVCSAWGSSEAAKRKLLATTAFAVDANINRNLSSTNTTAMRRFDPHEFMIDFSIWPQKNRANLPLLTMESECNPQSGVGASVEPANGYAYDFLKLALLPSPRRVFVCRVNEAHSTKKASPSRTQQTMRSLESIARATSVQIGEHELCVLILAASRRKRSQSILAVWNPHRQSFDQMVCDPS